MLAAASLSPSIYTPSPLNSRFPRNFHLSNTSTSALRSPRLIPSSTSISGSKRPIDHLLIPTTPTISFPLPRLFKKPRTFSPTTIPNTPRIAKMSPGTEESKGLNGISENSGVPLKNDIESIEAVSIKDMETMELGISKDSKDISLKNNNVVVVDDDDDVLVSPLPLIASTSTFTSTLSEISSGTVDPMPPVPPSPRRRPSPFRCSSPGGSISPKENALAGPSRNTTSPPLSFPPFRTMKRSNPKKLALSLSMPGSATTPEGSSTPAVTQQQQSTSNQTSSGSGSSSTSSTSTSTICLDSPMSFSTGVTSLDNTPYTPGPPKTPALAMHLPQGSSFPSTLPKIKPGNTFSRPSLLNLKIQPSRITTNAEYEVPPTPSAPGNMGHHRRRSNTSEELVSISKPTNFVTRNSRSAYPTLSIPSIPIPENDTNLSSLSYALPTSSTPPKSNTLNLGIIPSPSASGSRSGSGSGSGSQSGSSSSAFDHQNDDHSGTNTPGSSPPIPLDALDVDVDGDKEMSFKLNEPYNQGPIEIVPGVFLGAEDSLWYWDIWATGKKGVVRIMNVAQEIDNPLISSPLFSTKNRKGKGKIQVDTFSSISSNGEEPMEIKYAHLKWSHGEQGLAELDLGASLVDILDSTSLLDIEMEERERESWRFWEAIRWMEEGRRKGEPILIHCQCGVSRSATLMIAYIMALATSGVMPDILGGIRGMQDAYEFVKTRSSWVGPNVSLVFQLVEFARNLTTLLTAYLPLNPSIRERTSFPSAKEVQVSEDEWARQRAAFDNDDNLEAEVDIDVDVDVDVEVEDEYRQMGGVSREEVQIEADRLDQAMVDRKREKQEQGQGGKKGRLGRMLRVVC